MAVRKMPGNAGRQSYSFMRISDAAFDDALSALEGRAAALGKFASELDSKLRTATGLEAERYSRMLDAQQTQIAQAKAAADTLTKYMGDTIDVAKARTLDFVNFVRLNNKETRALLANLPADMAQATVEAMKYSIDGMEKNKPKMLKIIKDYFTKLDKQTREQLAPNGFLMMMAGMIDNTFVRRVTLGLLIVGKAFGRGILTIMKGVLKPILKFIKGTAHDIWTHVLNLVKSVWDKLKSLLFGNIFKEVEQKLKQLRDMFMEFPGAEKALENLRAIRDTLREARQQYGMTIEQSRELTRAIYENSDAYIRVEDNLRAIHAIQQAGVRDVGLQQEYMEDVTKLSRAYGESEESVVRTLQMLRREMGLTREEAFTRAVGIGQFVEAAAAQGGGYGTSVEEINRLYQQSRGAMLARGWTGETALGATMTTAQLGAETGANTEELMRFMMEAGARPSGALMAQLGAPADVLERLQQGDVAGFWQGIIESYRGMSEGQGVLFKTTLEQELGMSIESLELLANSFVDVDEVARIAADSLDIDYATAVDEATRAQIENTTPAELFQGRLEAIANGAQIAGVSFAEFVDLIDLSSTYFSELMGGFSMIEQGIQFAFGPLGGLIQPLATLPMVLMTIGGMFGGWTSEELGEMGILGEWFGAMGDFKDEIWPDIEDVLKKIWDGIQAFFQPGPNGERSLFGELLHRGVEWVTENGPYIITELATVIEQLFWALGEAVEALDESGIGDMLSKLLTKGLTAAIPIIKKAVDVFIDVMKTLFDVMSQVLNDPAVKPSLLAFGQSIINGLADIIHELAGPLGGVVSDLLECLIPTMVLLAEVLWDAFVGLMPGGVKAFLGIEEPEARRARTHIQELAVTQMGRGEVSSARGMVADYLEQAGKNIPVEEIADMLYFLEQTGGVPRAVYNENPMWRMAGLERAARSGEGAGEFSRSALATGRTGLMTSGRMQSLPVIGQMFVPGAMPATTPATQLLDTITQAESSGTNQAINPEGAMGFYGLTTGTARTAYDRYLAGGGEQIGEFGAGHTLSEDDIMGMTDEQQRLIASSELQYLMGFFADTETPIEWALAGYNAGSGIEGPSNYSNFYDWAEHLLEYPRAWISRSGLGYQTVTYVLRNRYMLETGGALRVPDDTLYQTYLGWPGMPMPADFGWVGGTSWDERPDSIHSPEFEDAANWALGTFSGELAEGGIVLKEAVARIGEAGPEVVMPLDELYAREDEQTERVVAAVKEQTAALTLVLEALGRADAIPILIGGRG